MRGGCAMAAQQGRGAPNLVNRTRDGVSRRSVVVHKEANDTVASRSTATATTSTATSRHVESRQEPPASARPGASNPAASGGLHRRRPRRICPNRDGGGVLLRVGEA